MVRVIRAGGHQNHSATGVGSHVETSLLTPTVPAAWHVDRIILAACQMGAGTDDSTLLRMFIMPDDVTVTDLSVTFPDSNDVNVWFKQMLFGSNPIYISWRPKRTVGRGEILYVDTIPQTYAANFEIEIFEQIFYHEL